MTFVLHVFNVQHLMQDGSPGALVNFAAGTVAAAAATLMTQPTDVIRTQMQLGASRANSPGTLAIFKTIIRQKGLSVLLAGAGPRVRIFPSHLIFRKHLLLASLVSVAAFDLAFSLLGWNLCRTIDSVKPSPWLDSIFVLIICSQIFAVASLVLVIALHLPFALPLRVEACVQCRSPTNWVIKYIDEHLVCLSRLNEWIRLENAVHVLVFKWCRKISCVAQINICKIISCCFTIALVFCLGGWYLIKERSRLLWDWALGFVGVETDSSDCIGVDFVWRAATSFASEGRRLAQSLTHVLFNLASYDISYI